MRSREPNTSLPGELPEGTEVYYYFKTSKQNVPIKWPTDVVNTTHPHFVTITTDRGRKTNIADKDIWIKPKNRQAQELSEGYMEDYIAVRLGQRS